MLKIICMRGLPGSGKTSLAKELCIKYEADGWRVNIFSTDDFWGENYDFRPQKIAEAHLWNQNRAMMAMIEARAETKHLIIIDNTNVCAWELRPYVKPAQLLGFEVEIVEPRTEWAFDAEVCAQKTTHKVPVEIVRAMLARWEICTPASCVHALAPWEKTA